MPNNNDPMKVNPPPEPQLDHKHTFEKVMDNVIKKVDTSSLDQYVLKDSHVDKSACTEEALDLRA